MTFFLPSFFQKRILRYALSRLEFLDADTLGLENLDIVWGKESVVELRQVGINIPKVSAILNIPPGFVVTTAKISAVRITVPSDLYKASIQVELDGIEVAVQVDGQQVSTLGDQSHSVKPKHGWSEKGTLPKNPSRQRGHDSQPHFVHAQQGKIRTPDHATVSDGINGDEEEEEVVEEEDIEEDGVQMPDTKAIAESFLESEPIDEKAELQAAVAESLYLNQSQTTVSSLEDPDIGVGNNVSLPGFLADFLKGVADRMKLRVKDLNLDLTMRLGLHQESPVVTADSISSNHVILRISIERLAIDDVFSSSKASREATHGNARQTLTNETRRISVTNVDVTLLSEPAVFSSLARSAAASAHGSPDRTSKPPTGASSARTMSSNDDSNSGMSGEHQSTLNAIASGGTFQGENVEIRSDAMESRYPSPSPTSSPKAAYLSPAGGEPYHDALYGAFQQIDDIPYERGAVTGDKITALSPRRSSDSSVIESTILETPYLEAGQPSVASLEIKGHGKMADMSASVDTLDRPRSTSRHGTSSLAATQSDVQARGSSSPESESSSSPSEDLSESKIFSHEQAASMYMSVMTADSPGNEQTSHIVPGGWKDSYSAGDDPLDRSNSEAQKATTSFSKLTGAVTSIQEGEELGRGLPRIPSVPSPNVDYKANPRDEKMMTDDDSNRKIHRADLCEFTDSAQRPFVMGKRIVSIDTVSVEFTFGQPETTSVQPPASVIIGMHMRQAANDRQLHSARISDRTAAMEPTERHLIIPGSSSQLSGSEISVQIGDMKIYADISLIKLIIMITDKAKTIPLASATPGRVHRTPRSSIGSLLKVSIQAMSWQFLDAVRDVSNGQSSDMSGRSSADAEVLLISSIEGFRLTHEDRQPGFVTTISASKFSVGYSSTEIMSIGATSDRSSTRTTPMMANGELKCTINCSGGTTFIDLSTPPIYASLDLTRLDETFSWFGGLSGILSLGNSMVSTITQAEVRAKDSVNRPPAARKVQFDTAGSGTKLGAHSTKDQKKITARIGGLTFDVLGTQCALHFQTSAMKLVSRNEGVGVQIDHIAFDGSNPRKAHIDPFCQIDIQNARIEYLTSPKEVDITRFLALVAPSMDKYERDDDILFDRLLSQRRQGGVLRVTVESVDANGSKLKDLNNLSSLADDLKKLSKVARYLPEDDRPGMLFLVLIRTVKMNISVNRKFGTVGVHAKSVEFAHVGAPLLTAFGVHEISVMRNRVQRLVRQAVSPQSWSALDLPMVMGRYVGNAMEPTVEIKLYNACFEYHVAAIMDMFAHDNHMSDSTISEMVSSVATITGLTPGYDAPEKSSNDDPESHSILAVKPLAARLDIAIKHSIIGLNPHDFDAKCLLVFTDTHFVGDTLSEGVTDAILAIKRASFMVIDDTNNLTKKEQTNSHGSLPASSNSEIEALEDMGYVAVSRISAASVKIKIVKPTGNTDAAIDVEIKDELFVFESCADSTQTFVDVINGLKPPISKSVELKYRTSVIPVEDMLASLSGNAYEIRRRQSTSSAEHHAVRPDMSDTSTDDGLESQVSVTDLDQNESSDFSDSMADSMLSDAFESLALPPISQESDVDDRPDHRREMLNAVQEHEPLTLMEDHFSSQSGPLGAALILKHPQHPGDSPAVTRVRRSPLEIRMRDVHIIWNLFDGYDWQHTREVIGQAVADVQSRATERLVRPQPRKPLEFEDREEDVVGDFLFNSIYIALPAKSDPADLTRHVNHNIDDLASEIGSHATSNSSRSPRRGDPAVRQTRGRRLRLQRSKHQKMTFELRGVAADVVVYPSGLGETDSLIDVRVHDLDVFDHVPSSTWRKFATYMQDAGEREHGSSMIHLEIRNVKPVPSLPASEIIMKASVLPLRLHVDQDTLDFLTRFFDFKDESRPANRIAKSEAPFIQRAEITSIRLKLDFKPKRVDYVGLRSGRTNEFMNFFILDSADMILRHAIIYGVSGFDRLGKTLNDIWMPDIKHNQLPGVLAGLAPLRSVVNVGSGIRDLVVVPIREYRKDGRIVRSLQKGALAFAKTTSSELMRLGAKLAIGTQTALQGAEDLLGQQRALPRRQDGRGDWDDEDFEEDPKKRISLYADQPVGVFQGLKGAYACLEQDLLMAKDAVVAMPGEVMESSSTGGAAKAVLRGAPTIILRPAMGVSRAVGQTLTGATNSIDPGHRRRAEDKYKRHQAM